MGGLQSNNPIRCSSGMASRPHEEHSRVSHALVYVCRLLVGGWQWLLLLLLLLLQVMIPLLLLLLLQ